MALSWLTSERPGDDGLPASQRIAAMCSVLLGTLLVVLDSSIVNVALPRIGDAIHVPDSSSIWISNIYQLVAAALILTSAALADHVGSKRLYVGGLLLFVLASIACAMSTSFMMLVISRALQGIGGAAVMSLGPSLNRKIFPSRLLGSAIGMVAMIVAVALAVGPTLGGVILAIASWRWLFLINIPVGGIALWMAIQALPNEPGKGGDFDVFGAVLSVIMLAASVFGLEHLQRGIPHQPAVICLVLAAIAAVLFCVRQQRTSKPLLPLSMFREVRFSLAAITSFFCFISQTMVLLALPFLLQRIQGYSPLAAGLLFTPWPVALCIVAPLAGRLADKVSPVWVASAGLLLFTFGLLSIALLSNQQHASIMDVIWRSALCGVGFGFFQAPNNRELMGSLPRDLSSRASGVQATVRTFAQSVGAALVALAFSGMMGTSGQGLPVGAALWLAFGIVVLTLFLSVGRTLYLKYQFSKHESAIE